jgi:hypothetical protein
MASIDFPNSPAVNDTFTAGNSSYRWTGLAWVSNNLAAITWTDVTGKPTTFPPSAHTHVIADTTGLQTALDGKQAIVSGVSSTEIGYLDGVTSAIQTQLNDKAATSHTHVVGDTTGLQTALDGKAATSHTHAISDVTSLQTSLDGKAATSHTHVIADTTGLQTALDGKAATSHTHTIANVTGLQAALDAKVAAIQPIQELTANYTLAAGSNGKLFYSASASTITVTVNFANIEVGERIDFLQTAAGKITISPFMGLQTVSDGNKLSTNGAGTALSLMCYAYDGTFKKLTVIGNLS